MGFCCSQGALVTGRMDSVHLKTQAIRPFLFLFKGAVCNNYGDLLTEMEYNTYNYVVSAI